MKVSISNLSSLAVAASAAARTGSLGTGTLFAMDGRLNLIVPAAWCHLSISCPAQGDLETHGVSVSRLVEAISSLSGDDVTIDFVKGVYRLRVGRRTIALSPTADDPPPIVEIPTDMRFRLPGRTLAEAIRGVRWSGGDNPIQIERTGDRMIVTATDGKRMAQARIDVPVSGVPKEGWWIRLGMSVCEYLERTLVADEIRFDTSESHLFVEQSAGDVLTRAALLRPSTEYASIPYQHVLVDPSDPNTWVAQVQAEPLSDIMGLISRMDMDTAIDGFASARLSFDGPRLKISSRGDDSAVVETVDMETGDAEKGTVIYIAARYLSQALQHIRGSAYVYGKKNEYVAVQIEPCEPGSIEYRYLIAPRVKDNDDEPSDLES